MPRRLLLALLLGVVMQPALVSAQSLPKWAEPSGAPAPAPMDTPETQGPGLPDVPPQVPVDGGLGLLALAGGAYALRKLRRRPDEQPT